MSAAVTLADVSDLIGGRIHGEGAVEIHSVAHDSRKVAPGSLFCCVSGQTSDGHAFAAAAVEQGAVALLCERRVSVDIPQLVVDNVREVMGPASSAVYGNPSGEMKVIGVTGTNGKTTVVTLIDQICIAAGLKSVTVGTLTGARTTPEAPELQALLAEAASDGVDVVSLEVSSHALDQFRVDGTSFDLVVFTNLGNDHLDYHDSPESYFAAKARLFSKQFSNRGLTNLDDVHGMLIRDVADIEMATFSLSDSEPLEVGPTGSTFTWRGYEVHTSLLGRFNVSNLLAAADSAAAIGIPDAVIAKAISSLLAPVGRLEAIERGQDFVALVDFAHTPDALEDILEAGRELAGGEGNLVIVFGCGGERDSTKRAPMGAVATRLADRVIITDDNPRGEDPNAIVQDIVEGAGPSAEVIRDRSEAIEAALASASRGDVVVIAGKGHEQSQTIGTRSVPFSDQDEVARVLDRLTGSPA